MKGVAILDSTFAARNRFKILATQVNMPVYEATRTDQLLSLLRTQTDIGLIITEIDFPQEDGFAILKTVMNNRRDIPVLVLTADNRRNSFVQAIQEGVADYVLKPFDGEYLITRVLVLLNQKEMRPSSGFLLKEKTLKIPALRLDFSSYIEKELSKAKKGGYAVSFLHSEIKGSTGSHNPGIYSDFHQELSEVLFDTDMFINSGHCYVGIFPFCGPEKQQLIGNKLTHAFKTICQNRQVASPLQLTCRFAAYPQDGESGEELIRLLEEENPKAEE